MRTDDMILVSVDDHVVEPPDLFKHHLAPEELDQAPKVIRRDDGSDVWVYDGKQIPNIALNAVAGRPPDEYGVEPTSFDDIRKGCYDVHARIDDMNVNGVLGAMCFPSFPQFCGQLFATSSDRETGLRMLRAYNDWHVDEWCGSYPGRFIPLTLPPLWDPLLMAEEVRRVAKKGCHAISFSENPSKLGYPSFHSDHWDPFFAACSDEGTILCLHIGSSSHLIMTAPDAPIDAMITLQPINIIQAATDLLWSPVLRKFPTLKFAMSEGGIGWIPYFLERVDYVYDHHRQWTGQDFGTQRPSEVFQDRIITCFIDDRTGIELRDRVGIDNITWECDYPHSDSTWPHAPETLASSLNGVSDVHINQITHENAMRHFRLDSFRHRPREKCTVGALRAEAKHVDVTPHSRGKKSGDPMLPFRTN